MFSEEEFVLEDEPVKHAETGREKNGRFAKGYSGNPNGRPKKPEVEQLREALERAKNKHGKDFLDHLVDRAYESDTIAVALGKKLLPDLKAVDANVEDKRLTPDQAIQLLSCTDDENVREAIRLLEEQLAKREARRAIEVPDAICTG